MLPCLLRLTVIAHHQPCFACKAPAKHRKILCPRSTPRIQHKLNLAAQATDGTMAKRSGAIHFSSTNQPERTGEIQSKIQAWQWHCGAHYARYTSDRGTHCAFGTEPPRLTPRQHVLAVKRVGFRCFKRMLSASIPVQKKHPTCTRPLLSRLPRLVGLLNELLLNSAGFRMRKLSAVKTCVGYHLQCHGSCLKHSKCWMNKNTEVNILRTRQNHTSFTPQWPGIVLHAHLLAQVYLRTCPRHGSVKLKVASRNAVLLRN